MFTISNPFNTFIYIFISSYDDIFISSYDVSHYI